MVEGLKAGWRERAQRADDEAAGSASSMSWRQRASGRDITMGANVLEDHAYKAKRGWCSNAGVWDVLGELSAFVYARLFFWPDPVEPLTGNLLPATAAGSPYSVVPGRWSYARWIGFGQPNGEV